MMDHLILQNKHTLIASATVSDLTTAFEVVAVGGSGAKPPTDACHLAALPCKNAIGSLVVISQLHFMQVVHTS